MGKKKQVKKAKVLVVDDDPDYLEVISSVLDSAGFEVTAEVNPVPALHRAFTEAYELILLDVEMPGMDGYELCERFKMHEDTFKIPILFLSGHRTEGDRFRGFFSGAHDYLVKPFNRGELIEKVESLIQQGRELRK